MAGRTEQTKRVATTVHINAASAITGSGVASIFQLQNPFPLGDIVYNSLDIRVYGNLQTTTGGGAVIEDGILQFIRQVFLSTPQHRFVIENISGTQLHDIMTYKAGAHPPRRDPAGTGAGTDPRFSATLRLPFKDYNSYNAADLGIDVNNSGAPMLQINFGAYTDIVQGGAAADGVDSLSVETTLRNDAGPVTDPDLPVDMMPYMGKFIYLATATGTQLSAGLAFGDRIIKRLFIHQVAGNTGRRLNNVVLGVSETDRVSLRMNSNSYIYDQVSWIALQDQNCMDSGLPAMPQGMAVMDFARPTLGGADSRGAQKEGYADVAGGSAGARLADALSVLSPNQGTLEALMDVTAGNDPNPQIHFIYEAVITLPLGARRKRPAPAVPARA